MNNQQDNSEKSNTIENLLELFGVCGTFFWGSILIITTFLFFLKQPLKPLNFYLSIVVTSILFYGYMYVKKFSISRFIIYSLLIPIIFAGILLITINISSKIYDLSYDGQAYHQEAIIQLTRRWNPVYIQLTDQSPGNLERWLNHYPKGVWIPEASIYQLTGSIESGKAFGMFSMILAFVFCLWALWGVKNISLLEKFLISAGLTLNPVVIYQLLSFYLDGILVSWLLIAAAILFKMAKEIKVHFFLPLLAATVVLVNIKLTSVVYAGILFACFIFYLWVSDRYMKALKLFKFLLISFAIGAVFVGYNPYVTNLALKGHPLYPTMGIQALDYVKDNTPESYWKMPSYERFFRSIFSVSSLSRGQGAKTELKWPFTFTKQELEAFRETNAKTGGFGPLFSGVFVLSLLVLLLNLIWKEKPIKEKLVIVGVIVGLMGVAGFVSTSSVSRFVPFVWWIPVLISLFVINSRALVWRISGVILLIILFVNVGLISSVYFPYNISESNKLASELKSLSQEKKTIFVDVGLFGSTIIKFKSLDIPYEIVSKDTICLSRHQFLVRNIAQICELKT